MGQAKERLRLERRRRGWTQNDVAELMIQTAISNRLPASKGLNAYYVSRWERGVVEPDPHHVHLLCLVFELPSERLGPPGKASPPPLGGSRSQPDDSRTNAHSFSEGGAAQAQPRATAGKRD